MENNFGLNLNNNESILINLKCYTDVKNKNIILNFLANFFIKPIGRVSNDYRLILTNTHLYINNISYSPIGGASEENNNLKISLKSIKNINVINKEDTEILNIETTNSKNTHLIFLRNNSKKDYLGEMFIKLYKEIN